MGYTYEQQRDYDQLHKKKKRAQRLARDSARTPAEKEQIRLARQQYRKLHKKEIAEYDKLWRTHKRLIDLEFKLLCNLRSRLNTALKKNYKTGSAVADLGCSIRELKAYLESKFQAGMSWDNWSPTGWHIDHIIPLSSGNLEDREFLLKVCRYTNLQPLWAEDNCRKGNRH